MAEPTTPEELQRWLDDVKMVDARLRQYEDVSREILKELHAAEPWHPNDREGFLQRRRAANAILVLCEQVRRRLVPSGNICHAVLDALMIGQWGGDGSFNFSNARARRQRTVKNRTNSRLPRERGGPSDEELELAVKTYRQKHPTASQHQIARDLANQFDQEKETIRARLKPKKKPR
jgi:hypothetical protein